MKINIWQKVVSNVKRFYNTFCKLMLRFVAKKFLNYYHFFLKKIYFKKYFSQELKPAKNILLCNCAGLDSVFISTFIIPVLKKAHPHCKIGILIGKNSSVFAAECPYIDWIHECKHWLHIADSRKKKFMYFVAFHVFHKRILARSLRKKKYDYALNLSPGYSDVTGIFLKAKIPVRIGYDAAGYQHLLSHCVPWKFDRYLANNHLELLKIIGIEETHLGSFQSPYLSSLILKVHRKVIEDLPEQFVLFDPCPVNFKNGFSKEFWMELKRLFEEKKRSVFFIGKGEEQAKWIAEIVSHEKQNLSNHLSYLELFQAINKSQMLVSVNSLSIHAAAALKRPCICLFNDPIELDLLRPDSALNIAFAKKNEDMWKKNRRNDESLIWVDHFSPKEIVQAEERLSNLMVISS